MKKRLLGIACLVASFALTGCGDNEKEKSSYDTMYEHLVYCWKQSLEGIHFDYAFFGDSRVIGGDFVAEFSDKSVVNLGVGGDRVRNLIDRFGLIKTVTPNKVFLAIGGNDVLAGTFTVEKFTSEYDELLKLFKNENIDVVVNNVVGITTVNSNYSQNDVDKKNSNMAIANQIIKQKAEEYNYAFVDIASIMNKENSNEMNGKYSADGVHFNLDGYRVWFDTLKPYF